MYSYLLCPPLLPPSPSSSPSSSPTSAPLLHTPPQALNLVTVPALRPRIREPTYTLTLHKTVTGVRDMCKKAGGEAVLGVAVSAVLLPILMAVVDCRPAIGECKRLFCGCIKGLLEAAQGVRLCNEY